MSVTRIRVTAKSLSPHASWEEKDRAFKMLFAAFKRHVNESGILTQYKERQTFESKTQKRRRKDCEADLLRKKELKTRLREHFG